MIFAMVQQWHMAIEKEIEVRDQLQYLFSVKNTDNELLPKSIVRKGPIEATNCDKIPCVIGNNKRHKRKRRGDKYNSRRIHRHTSLQDRELKRINHHDYYKKKEWFELDDGLLHDYILNNMYTYKYAQDICIYVYV
jgi:hypothetical protein